MIKYVNCFLFGSEYLIYFQEQDRLLQEVAASGIVQANFSYDQNPLMSAKDENFLAFVSSIDRRHQLIYIQPECYMGYMTQLTEQLE